MTTEFTIRAGLTAGAISSLVASAISLPLHSPHDGVFNTATVTAACLLTGLLAGLTWMLASTKNGKRPIFLAVSLMILFTLSAIVAIVLETYLLQRSISFIISLSAIALSIIGLLVPLLSRVRLLENIYVAPFVVLIAIGIGIGLSGQGDAMITHLELPPR